MVRIFKNSLKFVVIFRLIVIEVQPKSAVYWNICWYFSIFAEKKQVSTEIWSILKFS